MHWQPGTVILNKYRLGDLLGKGGNGSVLSATRIENGSRVAIKLCAGMPGDFPYQRLVNEARALQILSTKNEVFVPLVEVLQLDDAVGIVLPFLPGMDLFKWLKQRATALPWVEALPVIFPVAKALRVAHLHQIVHRDVKPANIFLHGTDNSTRWPAPDELMRIRLLDFGIARLPPGESTMPPTHVDMMLGSPKWCAPEQAPRALRAHLAPDLRDAAIAPATDIYALAATIFFALTKRFYLPFETAKDDSDKFHLLLKEEPSLELLPPDVPEYAVEFIARSLEKNPKDRPQDLSDFITDLEKDIVRSQEFETPTGTSAYDRPVDRTHPALIVVLVDESGSMSNVFGGGTTTKAQAVADVVNDYIDGLISTCQRRGGEMREYYQVAMIGYGKESSVRYLLPKQVMGMRELDEVARYERREAPDGDGSFEFPIWVEPRADGGTPMKAALEEARRVVAQWVSTHRDCHPAVVINITDGAATDGDVLECLPGLRALEGPPLLLCCHLSHRRGKPLLFPRECPTPLPDAHAKAMWELASELPARLLGNLYFVTGSEYPPGTKGYMFNVTDVDHLRWLLKAGTPRVR